jgi:hypothetical protein
VHRVHDRDLRPGFLHRLHASSWFSSSRSLILPAPRAHP